MIRITSFYLTFRWGRYSKAMINRYTWTNGLRNGFATTWRLGKIIFPITLGITILQYTPAIDWFVWLFQPMMSLVGLPGESALALVLGNLLNLYAAIGTILTMDLSVKEVFILAMMLSFSHALPVETAILRQIGIKAWPILLLRISLAISSAVVIHHFWQGGQQKAKFGFVPEQPEVVNGWLDIVIHGLYTACFGILQMALIIVPLMVGIQLLRDVNGLQICSKVVSPLTRFIGASDRTGVTFMAGLIFGLGYGAGVMMQTAKEDNLSVKDIYLISIFLAACHAVVEDTLIFIPLGINVLPLLIVRLVAAIVITAIIARIWSNKLDKNGT